MPTGQEDISLSKEEQLKSKLFNTAAKRLRFAHKFTGGETSLNLLSLVMPSEISGWSNPSAAEISAAKLLTNSANLQIISSLGYEVIEGVHFTVSSNSGLAFINGHTATAGEIYIGRFTVVPQSVLVADAKNYSRVVDFAAGDQIINVGFSYKVNTNSTQQKGDITVIKNGVQTLLRNVGNASASALADGNYEEYDPTGSGYSSAIKLNLPADAAGFFIFEGGLQLAQGDVKIFGAIERLASIVTALAADASQFFFGDNDLTRYLTASSNEVDRKTFGDLVLSLLSRVNILESKATGSFRAHTQAGHGSTNNKIPYYSTIVKNDHNGLFTINNSSVDGLSITFNKRCKLNITGTFRTGSSDAGGFSLNSAELTTSIFTINQATRLALGYPSSVADTTLVATATFSGTVEVGDVVRPHTVGNAPGSPDRCILSFLAEEI